jgi:hypothetical protein
MFSPQATYSHLTLPISILPQNRCLPKDLTASLSQLQASYRKISLLLATCKQVTLSLSILPQNHLFLATVSLVIAPLACHPRITPTPQLPPPQATLPASHIDLTLPMSLSPQNHSPPSKLPQIHRLPKQFTPNSPPPQAIYYKFTVFPRNLLQNLPLPRQSWPAYCLPSPLTIPISILPQIHSLHDEITTKSPSP